MAASETGYLAPYQRAAAKHGGSFQTTLWNSPQNQRVRFCVIAERLAERGPLPEQTILDVGCGRGDFLDYLLEIGQAPKQYVGIDALAEMIGAADAKNLPAARFIHDDFLANPTVLRRYQPAVLVYSGSLNTMRDREFFTALRAGYQATDVGMVFNFLSTRFGPDLVEDAISQRRDPARVVGELMVLGADRLQLRHDYMSDHDCTIAVWKD